MLDKSSVIWFNALYIVASKHLQFSVLPFKLGLHLGYGTDLMEAEHHEFVGLFGGLSADVSRFLRLMIEHDSEKFNGGAEIRLWGHARLLVALLHFESPAGRLSYSFQME